MSNISTAVGLIIGGVAAHLLYAWVARDRWGLPEGFDPDRTGSLLRLDPRSSWPPKEWRLHTLLSFIKRLGLLCIAAGATILFIAFVHFLWEY